MPAPGIPDVAWESVPWIPPGITSSVKDLLSNVRTLLPKVLLFNYCPESSVADQAQTKKFINFSCFT
jgi:hypothetical protein